MSAGRDMGRSRIPGSPSPAAQPSTERAQLARRYEQSPSFIPDAPPGYVPSSHVSCPLKPRPQHLSTLACCDLPA